MVLVGFVVGTERGKVDLVRGDERFGRDVLEGWGEVVFLEEDFTCEVNSASSKNPLAHKQQRELSRERWRVPGSIERRRFSSDELGFFCCKLRAPCPRTIVGKLYPSSALPFNPRPAGTVPYALALAPVYAELILVMEGVRECIPERTGLGWGLGGAFVEES
jgi:hypothetical protein